MKKVPFVIFALIVFFSCSDKSRVPKGILDKEKMQTVLWDMLRAGEYLNNFVFYKDTSLNKTAESLVWYNKVYESHNITKAEFEKSYDYYKEHPALMQEIIDSLAKRHADPGRDEQKHQAPLVPENTPIATDRMDSVKQRLSRFPQKNKARMIISDSLGKELSQ